jgi:hypothetical protein
MAMTRTKRTFHILTSDDLEQIRGGEGETTPPKTTIGPRGRDISTPPSPTTSST